MIKSYLKLAWKVLLRRKFFTFVSLFGISFTLLVLMLATALLDHVLAPLPPETNLDRTVGIFTARLEGERFRRTGFPGFALLDKYARDLPNVERMSIVSAPQGARSFLNGTRIDSMVKRTDGEFWRIMDFEFVEGGPFTADDVESGRFVAVINATTRQRFFGGIPALGRTLEVDGQRFTVVGVVPDVPALRVVPFGDIWVPHTTSKSDGYRFELVGDFMGVLLLRDPSQLAATRDELWSRLDRAELPDPSFTALEATPETLFDSMGRMVVAGGGGGKRVGFGRRLQIALAVAACLFMLLPAVNLINLNTSRIMERAPEIGVRKAFGASSVTLIAQFVVENVVLTLVGAGVGFVLAAWLLGVINASGLISYADLQLNYRIFGWGVALAVFFGLASGVYPAWRMSRLHPVQALKGSTR
jgi:putative ABC transport system permease protein